MNHNWFVTMVVNIARYLTHKQTDKQRWMMITEQRDGTRLVQTITGTKAIDYIIHSRIHQHTNVTLIRK